MYFVHLVPPPGGRVTDFPFEGASVGRSDVSRTEFDNKRKARKKREGPEQNIIISHSLAPGLPKTRRENLQ